MRLDKAPAGVRPGPRRAFQHKISLVLDTPRDACHSLDLYRIEASFSKPVFPLLPPEFPRGGIAEGGERVIGIENAVVRCQPQDRDKPFQGLRRVPGKEPAQELDSRP